MNRKYCKECGFTLIESLAAVTIMSFIGLAVLQSSLVGIRTNNKNMLSALATELAQDTLENYSCSDPESFSDGTSTTDEVSFHGKRFTRTVSISINSDRSREVDVKIESLGGLINVVFEASNSYPLWGQR